MPYYKSFRGFKQALRAGVTTYNASKLAQVTLAFSKFSREELKALVFNGKTAEIKQIFEWGMM